MQDYTLDEKIELLKYNIDNSLGASGLPLSISYYVLENYLQKIKILYDQYRENVVSSLNKKIEENDREQKMQQIEQELKESSENFKVEMREYQ